MTALDAALANGHRLGDFGVERRLRGLDGGIRDAGHDEARVDVVGADHRVGREGEQHAVDLVRFDDVRDGGEDVVNHERDSNRLGFMSQQESTERAQILEEKAKAEHAEKLRELACNFEVARTRDAILAGAVALAEVKIAQDNERAALRLAKKVTRRLEHLETLVTEWKAARKAFILAPHWPNGEPATMLDRCAKGLLTWRPGDHADSRASGKE